MDAYLMSGVWMMLSAILVLLMQGGFILLEAGSIRMKNAGHVAGKTIFTVGLCSIVFWFIGYSFIYAPGNLYIGGLDFAMLSPQTPTEGASYPQAVDFLFQLAFAAIALTIAMGGFAERAKLSVYLIFSVLFTAVVYPVVAHWIWSADGWLFGEGKLDFAGSTVVHLTGAMGALAATILLKPRLGKYNKDGTINPIFGHNQVYTSLGVLILWVGWFGFNAGSTLGIGDGFFGYVALNTQLAAGAGAVAALLISWIVLGKSDISTMLNGALAGLVGITASCAFVDSWAAVVIGLVAGLLVFFSAKMFDKFKIDDPIYALSVHGMAGIWGTLSNGLFATPALTADKGLGANGAGSGLFYGGGFDQLIVQLEGIVACGLFAFVASFIILYVTKLIIGLRVTEEEEMLGLDISEHGAFGYPEQIKSANKS
jgi:Amt family ammonium transporter